MVPDNQTAKSGHEHRTSHQQHKQRVTMDSQPNWLRTHEQRKHFLYRVTHSGHWTIVDGKHQQLHHQCHDNGFCALLHAEGRQKHGTIYL